METVLPWNVAVSCACAGASAFCHHASATTPPTITLNDAITAPFTAYFKGRPLRMESIPSCAGGDPAPTGLPSEQAGPDCIFRDNKRMESTTGDFLAAEHERWSTIVRELGV